MPNKIKLLRSTTAGAQPASLESGQVAINEADGKLFYRATNGAVTPLPTGGAPEVYEYATPANFPATGSAAQLVVATDTGRVYRWMGTAYVELGSVGGSVPDTRWDLFLPPAPTSVTASAGNAQAAVSWVAPTVLSQTAISDYIIQYSSNSGSTWTTFTDATSTATSATVTGLTNGTAYVFRVAAVNAVGTGSYSAASSAVTPSAGTPPGAPTGLTATAGNAQISLAWTAPSSVGSSAITGYSVEYTPSGGSAVTVNTGSTATSYTLTGLTNGTAYTARVAAVNAAGTGTYTAASSSVTPGAASVPGAPRSITVTPCGCGYATISWLAPLSDGGSAVTSYRLRTSLNSYATFRAVAADSPSTGCLHGSNVISGVNFYNPSWVLRIYAVNAIGESSSYAEFTENNGFLNSFGRDCG